LVGGRVVGARSYCHADRKAVSGSTRHLVGAAVVVTYLSLVGGGPALAQSAGPSITIAGSVTGELTQGSKVTFQLQATAPGGYQDLAQLQITLLLHNLLLAQFTYYAQIDSINVRGGQLVKLGTPAILDGSFFRISGLDVKTVASGNELQLTVPADVLQDIPVGAIFRLTASRLLGGSVSVDRQANIKVDTAGKGFSWGTLAAAVVAALFAGSFVGGLFASKRRRQTRPSVYGAIAERIARERPVK
jgi:hypothetical protein